MLSRQEIENILDLSKKAGAVILKYYRSHDLKVSEKSDQSAVTQADLEANDLIVAGLKKLFPEIAILFFIFLNITSPNKLGKKEH